jgi:hypothetical protein
MPRNDDDRLRGAAVEKTHSQHDMMPTASVGPLDLAQLDAQWMAAMAGAAQRDPRFAAFLLADSPDTRRARVRRQARREAPRPEIPTTTAPRPRRAPRRTMRDLAKEEPGAYAEYLDRAWARVDEEMWIAERRRNRPRLSHRSAGAGGPRRGKLVGGSGVAA